MASLRNLKKEINDLCYEVVSDCFTYILVHEEKNTKAAMKIITDTIRLRNDLIGRLKMPADAKTSTDMKKHCLKVRKDMISGMDKSLKKLSTLSSG